MRGNSEAFGYYFSVGVDIMASTVDAKTNVVTVTLGNSTTGTVDSSQATLLQQAGFTSVPAAPTNGQPSCQAIVLRRGDSDIVIGTRDVRVAFLYGNLKPGDTAVYATSGQAQGLFKNTGHAVLCTTSDNTAAGTTHSVDIGPDGFHVTTKYGTISLDANGFTVTIGTAALTMTPAGIVKLLGQQVAVQGALAAISGTVATCIGPAAAPTAPAAGPTSALHGLTGAAAAPSVNVFISP